MNPTSRLHQTQGRPPQATGNYTITITATVTGLQASYNATVGRELRIDFDLGNRQAAASASHTGLTVSAQRSSNKATLFVTPARTGAFSVTLSFDRAVGASGDRSTSTRARQSASSDSRDTQEIPINSNCAEGQIPGPHPNGTCIWDTDENLAAIQIGEHLRGSQRYEVTPALLDGAKRVAEQTLTRYSGCEMRTGELAAVMIAIGYWEYPIGDPNQRAPARSLMTLPRSHLDRHSAFYPKNEFKEPVDVRAFWHPGVGYWQLDWWPGDISHAERADIDKGGREVANQLAKAYCSPREGETETMSLMRFLDAEWKRGGWEACVGATDGDHLCYETFQKIYLGLESFSGTERLWVTTAQNTGDDHTRGGGVYAMSCRFGTAPTDFPCWLYDTESASIEGAFNGGTKYGALGGNSPLAAPFVSFTRSDTRFAVFPQSFAYPVGTTGTKITWIKTVPTDTRVRNTTPRSWHEDDYAGDELYVNICRPYIGGVPPICERLSTTDPSFAATVRGAYPGQSAGVGR
jgi:hypothetical protein